MPNTIPGVISDANTLHEGLIDDLDFAIDVPDVVIDTDIPMPPEDGPLFDEIPKISLADLTDGDPDGQGTFDKLMLSVDSHLKTQYESGRIQGSDYAKVYVGSIQTTLQQAVEFLTTKDRAYWETINAQATAQIALANRSRAIAEVKTAQLNLQIAQYEAIRIKLATHTATNEYALSKMRLVEGYNSIVLSENQNKLTGEQYEAARAQTQDTRSDGSAISGIIGVEKEMREAQMLTSREELDTARAQTKETLLDGQPIAGLVAISKQTAEAQLDLTQAQVDLSGAQLELTNAQKTLVDAQTTNAEEQADATRAQTKDTLRLGGAITGIVAEEKKLRAAQVSLVNEQIETARGQTRNTLTTGETVAGLVGAQTKLYDQQITSYKRDAESKYLRMIVDTWVARKTIDEGTPLPAMLDTTALNDALVASKTNLGL